VGGPGVDYVYLPLLLLFPLVAVGHLLGALASRQAGSPAAEPKRAPPPRWIEGLYAASSGRFAVKPHRAAGWYVLLPLPGFVGAYVLTAWVLLLFLFAAVNSSPFIYFQF